MLIRAYRDIPPTYAPDVHEVVLVRRTVCDRYTKAAVTSVRRIKSGHLRLRFVWMEDNPTARTPIVAGTTGYVTLDGQPLLLQISKDQPPAS